MVQFSKTKNLLSVLHLSESDTNCSITTKYVSKLVRDFLDKPLQKNSDSEGVCVSPHEDFISRIF